jgi:hypothetical protein
MINEFRFFSTSQQFFLYLLKLWQARCSAYRGRTDSQLAGNIRTADHQLANCNVTQVPDSKKKSKLYQTVAG